MWKICFEERTVKLLNIPEPLNVVQEYQIALISSSISPKAFIMCRNDKQREENISLNLKQLQIVKRFNMMPMPRTTQLPPKNWHKNLKPINSFQFVTQKQIYRFFSSPENSFRKLKSHVNARQTQITNHN